MKINKDIFWFFATDIIGIDFKNKREYHYKELFGIRKVIYDRAINNE